MKRPDNEHSQPIEVSDIELAMAAGIQQLDTAQRHDYMSFFPKRLRGYLAEISNQHPDAANQLRAREESRIIQWEIEKEERRKNRERIRPRDIPLAILGLGIVGGYLALRQGAQLIKKAASLPRDLRDTVRTIKH